MLLCLKILSFLFLLHISITTKIMFLFFVFLFVLQSCVNVFIFILLAFNVKEKFKCITEGFFFHIISFYFWIQIGLYFNTWNPSRIYYFFTLCSHGKYFRIVLWLNLKELTFDACDSEADIETPKASRILRKEMLTLPFHLWGWWSCQHKQILSKYIFLYLVYLQQILNIQPLFRFYRTNLFQSRM